MKPIKYIVEGERDALWGLSITTTGFEKIGQGEEYPTNRHIDSYWFSPDTGRVLHEYQLVYISEGSGTFESKSIPKTKIGAGTMFLLFPGEWHTYKPDKEQGWTQYWIGFKGANMDLRVKNGFFHKDSPIFNVGVTDEIVSLYMRAIDVAEHEHAYFQQMLAGIVNYLLGITYILDKNNRLNENKHLVDKINQARILMHENIEGTKTIQDIADGIGVSYSTFRKNFKKYTGLSPASYFQDLKLQRAKDLLRSTQMSIKEIAYLLDFETPDYFSTQFRKKVGKRPSDFRL